MRTRVIERSGHGLGWSSAPWVAPPGIPGTNFVFAPYDDSSRERYRDWYQHRYHHPADDLSTPLDWKAAGDFNRFFYALTQTVADAPGRIEWKPGGRPVPN